MTAGSRPELEPKVNGLALLKAVNHERYVFGAIVATRDDWREILDSIPAGQMRRNAAGAVLAIREALGLEADYAKEICQL